MSKSDRETSFFEFWPTWIMYFPVVIQWIFLSIRHRSLTVPFLANPCLKLSGMVGVPKSALMNQATGAAKDSILPWISFTVDESEASQQALLCIEKAKQDGIRLPFACKPDIGCRGVGVKLVESIEQLSEIIEAYPKDATLLCQQLASYEQEVGVFYVKNPHTGEVEIPSMTIKISPKLIGDGKRTISELIDEDSRASKLKHLYFERHRHQWQRVPENGEIVRLVFSASHSKGAIFIDARDEVTNELRVAIDKIMQGLPEFYYGRLDVKFKDLESLKLGHNLEVIEINGASAESIHIWDKNTSLKEAVRALLWQYRTLFNLGAFHRLRGETPPSLKEFLGAWQTERRLTRHYPLTD